LLSWELKRFCQGYEAACNFRKKHRSILILALAITIAPGCVLPPKKSLRG